ncbi:MAG TPA: UDP-N-acetylmuramate--L-alanine ligase [Caulobacteraceae bacterium]|nr:UDP-N-acetylmuramate--L-alanine ligase [Caulobacteraceae bacterium]
MARRVAPFDLGPVHFVGIGGIGMSAIAEMMLRLGYTVQGSDAKASANTRRLQGLGARVFIGHEGGQVEGASAIVYSTAVKADNPEILSGRARRIPLVRRAEMLAELMRFNYSIAVGGTHGKTTTTALVAALLDAGGLDPTVIAGGIVGAYGANAKLGEGEWMVAEADESDGSFLRLRSTAAVVTNIDPEHLDHHGDFDRLKAAFQGFVESIPFYGFAVLCIDDPNVQAMAAKIEDKRLIAYGLNPQADFRAEAVELNSGAEGVAFDVVARAADGSTHLERRLALPIPGRHNVLNALAAIAVARQLEVGWPAIRKGLAGFAGVGRRFTTVGRASGLRIVDDYGHHPVEIAAALAAARSVAGNGRVIAVVQPHRYTRLRDLFEEFCACFNDADALIVADVYPAGEAAIEGASRDALVEGVRRFGHRSVLGLEHPDLLPSLIAAEARDGDLVIFLGAGDITAWAHALPGQLEASAAA